MFDKSKSRLTIKNGWGYFPEYRSAITDDEGNKSLWPIERPVIMLNDIKEEEGPIYWAQEMMNSPIADHDMFTYDDCIACHDINIINRRVDFYPKIDDPHVTYAGADLSVSKKDYADFTSICTILVRDDGKLQIVDGERCKPGPEGLAGLFINKNMLMRWSNVCVENNGVQEFIVHQLGTYRIPVIPFTTGINKVDPSIGIPYIAALIKNKNLILPTGSHKAKLFTEIFIDELINFGSGHTGDVLMSVWFCVDLIRRINPVGSDAPLPNPNDDEIEIGYAGGELPVITELNNGAFDDDLFSEINDDVMGESFDTTNLPILGGF